MRHCPDPPWICGDDEALGNVPHDDDEDFMEPDDYDEGPTDEEISQALDQYERNLYRDY